jgi:CMD domain protein
MSTPPTLDVFDELAGLTADAPLAQLRRQRPDVVRHLQASDEAIFAPRNDGGLSAAERAAAGLRIAGLLRDARLETHYRARLRQHDPDGHLAASVAQQSTSIVDPRWRAILCHVDRLTADPESARREHIDGLLASGLSPRAVIALSQLVAYVNFQARLLAGLRILGDRP